jgi:hypothetical protein
VPMAATGFTANDVVIGLESGTLDVNALLKVIAQHTRSCATDAMTPAGTPLGPGHGAACPSPLPSAALVTSPLYSRGQVGGELGAGHGAGMVTSGAWLGCRRTLCMCCGTLCMCCGTLWDMCCGTLCMCCVCCVYA